MGAQEVSLLYAAHHPKIRASQGDRTLAIPSRPWLQASRLLGGMCVLAEEMGSGFPIPNLLPGDSGCAWKVPGLCSPR